MPRLKEKLIRSIQSGFGYSRLVEWVKLSGVTGFSQLLIQGIGLLSGIVVIRLLSTDEYALYTLANTMLGVMVILADGGIGAGVMAQGGKVYKQKAELGSVLNTGLDLRKKFAVGSLVVAAPILIYLLNDHGASWLMAGMIVLSLIPAFYSSLTGTIFQVPLKLKQDIRPLQKNIVLENSLRFALIFSLFLLPWTFIAILASGIPRVFTNIRLKKLSDRYVDWKQGINLGVRKKILAMVKRLMPGAIYYCVSGQVSIWLISVFGSTTGVAQIGALGRIALTTTVVSTLFGTLVYPRFARLPEKPTFLLKRFLQVMALVCGVCILLIAGVWLFSSQILWVLGNDYSGLGFELVLSIIASCIGIIGGGAFKMTTNRHWAIHPGVSIPVSILAIISGAILMDVSSVRGVLFFNIYVVFAQLLLNVGYFIFEIIRKINLAKTSE